MNQNRPTHGRGLAAPECNVLERWEKAVHYRRQAALARRAAAAETHPAIRGFLERAAQNFAEIADDIEAGAREVRHVKWLQWSDRNT